MKEWLEGLERFRRGLVELCGEEPAVLTAEVNTEIASSAAGLLAMTSAGAARGGLAMTGKMFLVDYFSWGLRAARGAVYRAEGGRFLRLAGCGAQPEEIGAGSPLPRWLAENGTLVRSRLSLAGLSAEEAEGFLAELDRLSAHLAAPIWVNDRLWGFFLAGERVDGGEYDGGEGLYLGLFGLELVRGLEERRMGLPPRGEREAAAQAQALREAQELWRSLRPAERRVRLLVLDDEPEAARALVQFFSRWGLEAAAASTQQEALLALRRLRPEIILSDRRLGEQVGAAALEGEPQMRLFPKPCRFAWLARWVFEAALGAALSGGEAERRRSCLIVDDEEEASAALKEHFEAKGCRAWTATTGEEALALVGRTKPDMVLLDLRLPALSGKPLIERIRAASPRSRVVVLTAWMEEDPQEALERLKPDAYRIKPVPVEELSQLLEA